MSTLTCFFHLDHHTLVTEERALVLNRRLTLYIWSWQTMWSEGRQYPHVCCHLQWWRPCPHTNYRPIQFGTPHHITWYTEWKTLSTQRERAVEAWHDSVHHHLGQCCLPLLSTCKWMVCSTAPYDCANSSLHTLLFWTQLRNFICGIWSPDDDPMSLLEVMNAGCLAIGAEDCQEWIHNVRRFFLWCIATENIKCNVYVA